MKTKRVLILLCALFVLSGMQHLSAQNKKGKETVTFYVEEFNCKNCQAKIEKNIAFETGVADLKCDLKTKTVEVVYKTDKTNPDKLVKGFEKLGFTAEKVDPEKLKK